MDEQRPGPRRVVITGMGVLSGPAVGVDEFWDALVGPPPAATHRKLEGFDPRRWLDRRRAQRTDRFAQAAVASAALAHDDAGAPAIDPERTAVVYGVGNGGLLTIMAECSAFERMGPAGASELAGVMLMTNAGAANIAFHLGIHGTVYAVAGGCASGTAALVEAYRLLRHGDADVVYTGGSEACLASDEIAGDPVPAGLVKLRVHTTDDVVRPFDADRSGFIFSEGAAALRFETLEAAQAQGARIYAEVLAGANTVDGHDLITPAPRGSGLQRAFRQALRQAGADESQVGYVNVHGSGTPTNDQVESDAITDVFRADGQVGPAVSSVKAVTGHPGGAAGAVEAVATVLAMQRRTVPPTRFVRTVDPAIEVDVVTEPRPWEPGLAFSTSMGLGGQNAAILFGPAPETP
ncbi:MAG TPA: beta-ketoacyl-[acyl-carrier-protein] synthase family protein [Acidimicrobiales bacterium]|nr:beta-ketoacyl-[acyl-carrier-protein] synthase family protein [Acidimicrobiales bacterium]